MSSSTLGTLDELELILELELELKDSVNFLRPSQAFLGSP